VRATRSDRPDRGLRRVRGAALAAAALAAATACGEPRAPDVVLISLDSVRADALTFDDPAAAPRLAALAEDATVFGQAVSGSSWTLPAHAQMFTGQPPVVHGVQYDDIAIDPHCPTLPELLGDAGWFTAGFWTGWYLAGEYGFERGFAVYQNAMTGGAALEREYERALDAGDVARAQQVLGGRDVMSHQDVTSPVVVDRVRATLSRLDPEEPVFLFAHFFDPHYDYVPPAPWDTRFDPDYEGDYDGRDFYRNERIFDGERRIPDRDLEHVVALYRGEIGWTDAAVGRVLDLLEEHDRLDDAVVVVTADHGDEFFEHGGRGHRHTLFEELVRVPLLVRLPDSMRGEAVPRVDAQVSLSDVLPTLLEVAGVPVPATVFGRSLLPLLRGGTLPPRPLVGSLSLTGAGGAARVTRLVDSLRTEEWKLVRELDVAPGASRPRVRASAWFDLAADPGEQRPVVRPDHPAAREAAALLDRELERLRTRWQDLPRSPDERRATRIREVFQADLGDLGYADGESEPVSPGFALPWGLGPHPPPAPDRPPADDPRTEPSDG
jgi:arylsulfatase A-like enzyme